MRPLTIQSILTACHGTLRSGSAEGIASRICTDSREAKKGDLFVALEGDRFDGHSFLGEVARRGVQAVLVDHRKAPPTLPGCAIIAVANPRIAMGQLAAWYRKQFDLPVVAVGGSNGKTTTKDLIAAVLRHQFR